MMDTKVKDQSNSPEKTIEPDEAGKVMNDDESIDRALIQMGLIYKSRCIQPPRGSNVTIREITKDE
ncbi:MAG: hypothetical protein WBB23_21990 [Desulforhopalus sp.]